MTKEQAIEALKEHKRQIDKKYINTRNSKAIETVLSMLEEQEKKIEDLQKSVNQIYDDYQDIGKMAFDYSDKIEEQDKMIDLMSEDIYNYQIECNRYFKDKEEAKQYFENKAKELLNK